ncbi:MAG: hypothetical protein GY861_04885 [bacterium]|nr:hypothetical protein [bacterium]
MNLTARKIDKYYEIIIEEQTTVIETGLLDKAACKELAEHLRDVAEVIDPVE